jgi:hypothetical protein
LSPLTVDIDRHLSRQRIPLRYSMWYGNTLHTSCSQINYWKNPRLWPSCWIQSRPATQLQYIILYLHIGMKESERDEEGWISDCVSYSGERGIELMPKKSPWAWVLSMFFIRLCPKVQNCSPAKKTKAGTLKNPLN